MTAERSGDEEDTHEGFVFDNSDEDGDRDTTDKDDEETAFSFLGEEDVASEPTDDADGSSDSTAAASNDSLPTVGNDTPGGTESDPTTTADPERTADEAADGEDAPLSGLTDRIRDREAEEDFDDLFDREDIEDVDREELWEQVEGTDDPLEDLTVEREVREVSKVKYCHQCEYFSAPPEVTCENEGTEIVELVDLETFRVVDCPVVLKDERLEEKR